MPSPQIIISLCHFMAEMPSLAIYLFGLMVCPFLRCKLPPTSLTNPQFFPTLIRMSLFKLLFPPLAPLSYHLLCLLSQFCNRVFVSLKFWSVTTIDSKFHEDRDLAPFSLSSSWNRMTKNVPNKYWFG